MQVRGRPPYISLYLPISPRCENDFQIDIATAEGRAEYKRIIDRAAELEGILLFFSIFLLGLWPT